MMPLGSTISMILSICWGKASLIKTMSKYWLISYKKCCEYGLKMKVLDRFVPWQKTETKSITSVYLSQGSIYGLGATARKGMDFCLLARHK